MTYSENTNLWLAGKTIRKADVSGHAVVLEFEDGSVLDYSASDGGYSCWGLRTATGDRVRFDEGGTKKDPTDKQMQFATEIAKTLRIELPAERTRQSLFLFIRDNVPRFKEKKSVDRHNARVHTMAYESENPDNDPDNDWAFMDAMGVDSLTGGFEDNY